MAEIDENSLINTEKVVAAVKKKKFQKSPIPGGENWDAVAVEKHVKYMMGDDIYARMKSGDWKGIQSMCPLWRDTFTIHDYGKINYARNAVALDDIVMRDAKLVTGTKFTTNNVFPLRMSDGCRERNNLLISSSRLANVHTWVMLYPRVNRLTPKYYRNAIRHDCPFNRKRKGVTWRGVDSGNIWTETIPGRSNRLEISKLWDGYKSTNGQKEPTWDIGITDFVQSRKTNPGKDFSQYAKGKLSVHELIKQKYTLCIGGNDVSSQFLWALASNTVPIHPYPYFFETYWYDGGEGTTSLEPWVHFVPIRHDASDLAEKYEWCVHNYAKCIEIISNGKKHAARYLSDGFSEAVRDRFVQIYSLSKEYM